jgi:hypothetical protein
MQYRPALLTGFLTGTGLEFGTVPVTPALEDH